MLNRPTFGGHITSRGPFFYGNVTKNEGNVAKNAW